MDEYEGICAPSDPIQVEEPRHHFVRAPVQFLGEKPSIARQAIGYYVDKKHFGTKLAQAEGFAKNRVKLYGRRVEVKYIAHDGVETIVETFDP